MSHLTFCVRDKKSYEYLNLSLNDLFIAWRIEGFYGDEINKMPEISTKNEAIEILSEIGGAEDGRT